MLTYTPAELRALDRADSAPHVLFARYCLRLVCGGQLGNVFAGQRHCLGAHLFTGAPCATAVTQASDQLIGGVQ